MNVPKFTKSDTINTYIAKSEDFLMKLQHHKYNSILEFIREWANIQFKSLCQFRYMREDILLKDPAYNEVIVKKYISIFNKEFNIEINVRENDELDKLYIIDLLRLMLNCLNLNYKLSSWSKGSHKYYSINKILIY